MLCGFLSHLVIEPTSESPDGFKSPRPAIGSNAGHCRGQAHFAAMGLGSLHGLARPMLVLTDLTCHHVTDLISKMERFRVVTRQWMNLGMNLLEKTQKRVGEETEFGMLMNAKKARMNWCAAILSSSNWKSEEQTSTKRYLMSNLRKFNQWTINDLYINRGGG